MFHRNFVVRRSLFLILIGSACISTVLGGPVWGGGVTVVNTILSDNGDDDGFADTQETVTIRLVIENTSGIDLTGVWVDQPVDTADHAEGAFFQVAANAVRLGGLRRTP